MYKWLGRGTIVVAALSLGASGGGGGSGGGCDMSTLFSLASPYTSIGTSTPVDVSIDSNWGAGHNTVGDTLTFTASATGGTPPYTYFWSFDGAGWTTGSSSYSVTVSTDGYHTIDVVARDATGQDSDAVGIGNLYIESADGATDTAGITSGGSSTSGGSTNDNAGTSSSDCPSPQGTFPGSTWGDLTLVVSGSNNGGTSPVNGTYTYRHGVVSGTLDWTQQKIAGTWTEYYDDGTLAGTGEFEWTFSGDYKWFSGWWKWSSSSAPVGNWGGSRSTCN
ncbi:MAG: hypothetical protein HZB38_04750 [Planctomycetes bacterium]|nr:hypothetical protein [Planctomycetota bacterium]